MTGLPSIPLDGMYHSMYRGYGFGQNTEGLYPTSLVDAMTKAAESADEFPHTFKFGLLLGRYVDRTHGGHFHAKAQNQCCLLRGAYDEVLAKYDLLLMLTIPMKKSQIPPKGTQGSSRSCSTPGR